MIMATEHQVAKGGRVYLLDLLRIVAVVMVALFHFGYRGAIDQGYQQVAFPELAWLGRYGFFGVELFFIISGYVIVYSVHGRTLTEFAVARMVRLYPTFWLCCLLTTAVVLIGDQPKLKVGAFDWLMNLPILTAGKAGTSFVDSAYWSLAIEIQFYVVVALIHRFARDLVPGLLVWALLSIPIIAIEIATGRSLPFPGASFVGFFALGAAIYFIRQRGAALLPLLLLAAGGLSALGKTYLLQVGANDKYDAGLSLPICLALVLLSAVAVYWTTGVDVRSRLVRKALMFGGGLTYPFYLLHQNIGYTGINMLTPGIGRWAALGLSLTAILVLSILVYQWFDLPVRRGLKRLLDRTIVGRGSRADFVGAPLGAGPGAEAGERQL